MRFLHKIAIVFYVNDMLAHLPELPLLHTIDIAKGFTHEVEYAAL